jgi:hypothetical protein
MSEDGCQSRVTYEEIKSSYTGSDTQATQTNKQGDGFPGNMKQVSAMQGIDMQTLCDENCVCDLRSGISCLSNIHHCSQHQTINFSYSENPEFCF